MQTFITSLNLCESAASLDTRRLNNQINENMVILRTITGWYEQHEMKGWPNHPNVTRWRNFELVLTNYTYELLNEYYQRNLDNEKVHPGIINRLEYLKELIDLLPEDRQEAIYPEWLNEDFCAEHRRILLEKDFAFYSKKFDANGR